jgi:uncharacterized protein involved in outer membrane biogenesis
MIFAAIALGLGTAIAVLTLDANILRQPIASYVTHKLDRPFAINGDLHIGLFKHPHVEANGVVLANAPWATQATMVQVERVKVSIELIPLFGGRIILPEVELTRPDVVLERDIDGEANWNLERDRSAPSSGSVHPPEIHSLRIENGKLTFRDPAVRTQIELALDSDRGEADGESSVRFTGRGSLRNQEFHLEGSAGSLLELREAGKPYRVDAKASAGDTKIAFAGTVVPVKLETIDGDVDVTGKDLAKLYPIIPVPLPWTSSYQLSGHLKREGEKYSLRGIKGRVGSSDLEGDASIDLTGTRPQLTADLTSKRLDYKDLLGFLGVPPPSKGKPRPPDQQEQAEELEETGRVLSSKPYSLERLRAADAQVKFKGESILARDIPLDNVAVQLKLKNGTLVLGPLDFGVGGGHVVSRLTLDASQDVIRTDVDATASNLEVKALFPKLKENQGSAGKLGGRAKLSTKGNSVAQMAASANGEMALIMSKGRVSTLGLVLTNLDLANAVKYLLRGDPNAPVYCAVMSAEVRAGELVPNIFVVDTSEENITGEGAVDFKTEQYKLRLVAHSKRASLIALRGPIRIGGTFERPTVHPEMAPVAARVGAATALGVLLTPVASLLALVDPGGAKGSNCPALIDQAKGAVATTPTVSSGKTR